MVGITRLKTSALILITLGFLISGLSYGNIDISYNMLYIGIDYDTSPFNSVRSTVEIHQTGLQQYLISQSLLLIGFCFLLLDPLIKTSR